jgi:hypothetical protein
MIVLRELIHFLIFLNRSSTAAGTRIIAIAPIEPPE